jgi:hypothetical protein
MIVEPRTKRERRRSFPMRFVEKFSVQKFLRACIISSTASAGEMPLREKFSSPPGTFAVLTASDASRLSRAELLRSTVGKYHRQVGRRG